MAFQVSPGVNISEIDLTTIIPAVATTVGGIGGCFRWGPCEKPTLVDSETKLAARFGKPTDYNAETFFSAANFLAYGNALYVSRAFDSTNMLNAFANVAAPASNSALIVKNADHYVETVETREAETDVLYIAKYPGELGNSLKISVCDSANAYTSTANLKSVASNSSFDSSGTKLSIAVGSTSAVINLANSVAVTDDTPLAHANVVKALYTVGDYIKVGNSSIGYQEIKIKSIGDVAVANTEGTNTGSASITLTLENKYRLSTAWESQNVERFWEYHNNVESAPGTSATMEALDSSVVDEMHVVIVDEDGKFTGQQNAILEVFQGVSRATDAKTSEGASNYYKNVLNNGSQYVWFNADRSEAPSALSTATGTPLANSTASTPLSISFAAGADGGNETDSGIAFGDVARAYDTFSSAADVDVSLVITGKSRGGTTTINGRTVTGFQLGNYLIDNIAEIRKDCVVFVSPEKADVVSNVESDESQDVVDFRGALTSSSYAVLDSGYKYQYDKYNDVYRWIPLNGDIAGLAVRTDLVNDPWWSPAGFNRGIIKNVVKLAYNPTQADRDLLYKNGVNPVVTFPGQGTILYGDKTLQSKPSAFDRINVRRLFIVLEKAISRAAQAYLFEFNDEFTRSSFNNLVEPYLRDIQSRRGITDFKVVCDDSNNTAEVIDSNRFVGDIYIKPARAINFIQLNFVAVRTGVEFSEITGQF